MYGASGCICLDREKRPPDSSGFLFRFCFVPGYEPRRLFNVVEFVMNDKDGSGEVSLEEAMQIMYLRYGRGLLDSQLEEIFGTSDLNSGKTLSLTEFLRSLHANQV